MHIQLLTQSSLLLSLFNFPSLVLLETYLVAQWLKVCSQPVFSTPKPRPTPITQFLVCVCYKSLATRLCLSVACPKTAQQQWDHVVCLLIYINYYINMSGQPLLKQQRLQSKRKGNSYSDMPKSRLTESDIIEFSIRWK